jgi:hypothetical protein
MRMLPADLAVVDPHPLSRNARVSLAFAKMMYIFGYPEDERLKNEALATMSSEALGRVQADPQTFAGRGLTPLGISASDTAHQFGDKWINKIAEGAATIVARELFLPAGGFSSVARAKGTDFVQINREKNLRNAIFCGIGLYTLYQIANHKADAIKNGASLNRFGIC